MLPGHAWAPTRDSPAAAPGGPPRRAGLGGSKPGTPPPSRLLLPRCWVGAVRHGARSQPAQGIPGVGGRWGERGFSTEIASLSAAAEPLRRARFIPWQVNPWGETFTRHGCHPWGCGQEGRWGYRDRYRACPESWGPRVYLKTHPQKVWLGASTPFSVGGLYAWLGWGGEGGCPPCFPPHGGGMYRPHGGIHGTKPRCQPAWAGGGGWGIK